MEDSFFPYKRDTIASIRRDIEKKKLVKIKEYEGYLGPYPYVFAYFNDDTRLMFAIGASKGKLYIVDIRD